MKLSLAVVRLSINVIKQVHSAPILYGLITQITDSSSQQWLEIQQATISCHTAASEESYRGCDANPCAGPPHRAPCAKSFLALSSPLSRRKTGQGLFWATSARYLGVVRSTPYTQWGATPTLRHCDSPPQILCASMLPLLSAVLSVKAQMIGGGTRYSVLTDCCWVSGLKFQVLAVIRVKS